MRTRKFQTTRLAMMAVLIALQIILTRITSISIGAWLRISFGFLPTAIAGYLMGPLASLAVAGVADVLGVVLTGQTVIIGLTVTAMFDGFMYGLILHQKPIKPWRTALALLPMAIITSMLLNTFILANVGYLSVSNGAEWPAALQWFEESWQSAGLALPNWISLSNRVIKAAVQYPVNVAMLFALLKAVYKMPASAKNRL